MFDFTKEIILDQTNQKIYRCWQVVLYLAIIVAAVYLSYPIIFAPKNFFFNFYDPDANKNNITNPNWKDNILFFDTNISSDYSAADVKIVLEKENQNLSLGQIAVRRSYQAFMYDTGTPIGFKDGILLKSDSHFYIVSDGTLRQFPSENILKEMGYSSESFVDVSQEDLKFNSFGKPVDKNSYPNDTLFSVEDNYYILKNGQLKKFISDQAYLSSYLPEQAISKEKEFLENFTLSEDLAGFSDGALVSNGGSVYILSRGKFFPIDSALTFTEKGYFWDDVIPVGSNALASLEKEKIFNIKVPHPDGTIFRTKESEKYYLIRDGQKHLLPSAAAAASWGKRQPILVDEKSLEITAECQPEKKIFSSHTYSCQIPLDNLSDLIGFNYEFELDVPESTKISALSVKYKKSLNKNNLKAFLVNTYYALKTNYATN